MPSTIAPARLPRAASGPGRPRSGSRRPPPSRIRWDRVGRLALLGVLGVILLLYVSPVTHWIEQRRTAARQQAELRYLEREHDRLSRRVGELRRPGAVEREARRLGMVRTGEQAFVIERGGR